MCLHKSRELIELWPHNCCFVLPWRKAEKLAIAALMLSNSSYYKGKVHRNSETILLLHETFYRYFYGLVHWIRCNTSDMTLMTSSHIFGFEKHPSTVWWMRLWSEKTKWDATQRNCLWKSPSHNWHELAWMMTSYASGTVLRPVWGSPGK